MKEGSLRVIGAGWGRTGTNSLKVALEQLLGGPCYHMLELTEHPADLRYWEQALRGERVDWAGLFGGYRAAVDWPASAYWRELAAVFPDAVVLLSTRDSAQTWWSSFERTIVPAVVSPGDTEHAARRAMIRAMFNQRLAPDWMRREDAIAAYERHGDEVRATVAPGRLVDWQPGDGWEPICAALGIPVPEHPFPHENAAADFRARLGLDSDD